MISRNEETEDIMNIVKSLKEARLLVKDVSKTIENKEIKRVGFLNKKLGALGVGLLGNLLSSKTKEQEHCFEDEEQSEMVMKLSEMAVKQLGRDSVFNYVSSFHYF